MGRDPGQKLAAQLASHCYHLNENVKGFLTQGTLSQHDSGALHAQQSELKKLREILAEYNEEVAA